MLKRKNIKDRGKLRFSLYFQNFNKDDKVAIIRDHSLNPAFPKRIQGKTGIVVGKRGEAYIVMIKDGDAKKMHIIKPLHLKKIK